MPVAEGEARAILERALAATKADEAEVWLTGGAQALTRFAENTIHQNVAERGYDLVVRAAFGKRTAVAYTNRLDEAGVKACVANAERNARIIPEIPDLLPVVEDGGALAKVEAFDAATAAVTPEARAEAVRKVVEACKAEGAKAAGAFEVVDGRVGDYGERGTVAMLNSKGLFRYHASTAAEFVVTATRGDATGWARGESWRVGDLDPAALGRRALAKAVAGENPRDLAPGRYKVVLEPAAAAEFCAWYLAGAFSALAVDEGRSPLSGRLGERIGGENVTVTDDVAALGASPFDEEGTATRRVTLIEKGVQKGLLHDRKTAKKLKAENTGHAPRQPSTWGPGAKAVVVAGGSGTAEDLVKTVDRGVLVTRFWYSNMVDERQGLVTGMTRDGLFWIEDGEVRHPLRNMRYNESVIGLLSRIDRLGAQERMYGALVPAMVVKDFNFASGTKF
jgi:PmbA protein